MHMLACEVSLEQMLRVAMTDEGEAGVLIARADRHIHHGGRPLCVRMCVCAYVRMRVYVRMHVCMHVCISRRTSSGVVGKAWHGKS